ncbi:MAG: class I SAM-dependent methyltransferase [Chloroflexota bacterium]|nr:class I SAM-dependent methyltransferase [Chloroflexota bacterium]
MDQHHRDAADGWEYSAAAYTAFQDLGDKNRTVLLDPVMLEQCGDVKGLRVLDLGCGEGRFSRMLAQRGARVTGIDLTAEMARTAQDRRVGDDGYLRATAEQLPFPSGAFDVVISYVTLVDIVDYRAAIAEAARVLEPGGCLVVANLGFVTASSGWLRDDEGKRVYHRVDRYADEFSQVFEWRARELIPDPERFDDFFHRIRITNWHRPLSAYMSAYLDAGLVLRSFLEPVPDDQSLRNDDFYEDWFRVPLFNVMKWQKP